MDSRLAQLSAAVTVPNDPRPGRVYALVDPRDGGLRYVGKTVYSPERRLAGHINHAKKNGRSRCSRWILRLLELELRPEVVVLEETPEGVGLLNEAECRWIAKLRAEGVDLCNQTTGGDGGPTMLGRTQTAEARALVAAANKKAANPERARKIAESKRRQWANPEYRAKMLEAGKKGSAAAAKKAVGKPGTPHTDETRAKIKAARARQVITPETGAKISKALKGTGKTHPPGWADKVRETRARKRAEREGR